jgi:hypothetical protein
MASGNVDLLRESLTVAGEGTPEIVVTLGVSSPPPWVKVSGRVVGTTLTGNERINLTGPAAGEILETMVLPDGGFEFPKVLPGQYNGRIQSLAPAVIADPLTLVVGTTDINNWEVRLPATVDVQGHVIFAGPPIPTTLGIRSTAIRFTLTAANGMRRSVGAVVFAQQNGGFILPLPEGSNRLSLDTLPAGYVVKSMTYGTADLLTSDLTIDSKVVRDLTIVLEPAAGTWVKVSGRVTGLEQNFSRAQVTLLGNAQAGAFEAIANPDGSFEFPRVWPGSYSARVFVASPLGINTATTLVVPSTDLTGIEFKMPKYRDAIGRISLEGAALALQPRFWLTLTAANTPANTVTVYPVSPGDAGFRIPLPEGEWRVALGGLPADLNVRSLTYGDVDLLKSAVRFTDADAQQLQLTFGVSAAGLVRLSGRVIGPLRQSDTIRLTGVASAETRLQPDGTFEFPRVLPGSYSWGFAYGWTRIAVPNKDLTDLTIRSIRGRVVFEEPTAAQPTPLYVQASDGGGTSAASVQRDGSFVLITAEGTYRLTMSTIPIGMYVKSIRYGDSDVVNQLLIVAPGQETSNLEIVIGRRP